MDIDLSIVKVEDFQLDDDYFDSRPGPSGQRDPRGGGVSGFYNTRSSGRSRSSNNGPPPSSGRNRSGAPGIESLQMHWTPRDEDGNLVTIKVEPVMDEEYCVNQCDCPRENEDTTSPSAHLMLAEESTFAKDGGGFPYITSCTGGDGEFIKREILLSETSLADEYCEEVVAGGRNAPAHCLLDGADQLTAQYVDGCAESITACSVRESIGGKSPNRGESDGRDSEMETIELVPVTIPDGDSPNAKMSVNPGAEMPSGIGMPSGIKMPPGIKMPSGIELPSGIEMPSGVEIPSGIEMPSGIKLPSGIEMPSGNKKAFLPSETSAASLAAQSDSPEEPKSQKSDCTLAERRSRRGSYKINGRRSSKRLESNQIDLKKCHSMLHESSLSKTGVRGPFSRNTISSEELKQNRADWPANLYDGNRNFVSDKNGLSLISDLLKSGDMMNDQMYYSAIEKQPPELICRNEVQLCYRMAISLCAESNSAEAEMKSNRSAGSERLKSKTRISDGPKNDSGGIRGDNVNGCLPLCCINKNGDSMCGAPVDSDVQRTTVEVSNGPGVNGFGTNERFPDGYLDVFIEKCSTEEGTASNNSRLIESLDRVSNSLLSREISKNSGESGSSEASIELGASPFAARAKKWLQDADIQSKVGFESEEHLRKITFDASQHEISKTADTLSDTCADGLPRQNGCIHQKNADPQNSDCPFEEADSAASHASHLEAEPLRDCQNTSQKSGPRQTVNCGDRSRFSPSRKNPAPYKGNPESLYPEYESLPILLDSGPSCDPVKLLDDVTSDGKKLIFEHRSKTGDFEAGDRRYVKPGENGRKSVIMAPEIDQQTNSSGSECFSQGPCHRSHFEIDSDFSDVLRSGSDTEFDEVQVSMPPKPSEQLVLPESSDLDRASLLPDLTCPSVRPLTPDAEDFLVGATPPSAEIRHPTPPLSAEVRDPTPPLPADRHPTDEEMKKRR
ncbi:unnamed protein product, partial [Nesidiocoris tenuis]